MQIMDASFQAMEVEGKTLINAGVLKQADIDAALKGNKSAFKIMTVGLPAYSNLRLLVRSAKSNTTGFLLCNHITTTLSS